MATAAAFGRASSIEALRADPARELGHDLYEKYAHNVYAFCFSRLGKREEAEDAIQTTFLNAYRSLRRGVVPEFELAWLLKIANHVILNRRRAASRRRRLETPRDLSEMQDVFSAHERDVDELIGIERVIASLPPRQRQAFLLREMQGLSYREVAEKLGLTQGAVETLLFRARRSLAEGLEQPNAPRRRLAGFDLGSILAPIKLFLTGGAGLKLAAATLAVATPVAIEANLSRPATSPTPSAASTLAAPAVSGPVEPGFSTPVDLRRPVIGVRTGVAAGRPLDAPCSSRAPVEDGARPAEAETVPAVVAIASSEAEHEPVGSPAGQTGPDASLPESRQTPPETGTTGSAEAAAAATQFGELASTVSIDAQSAPSDESEGASLGAPTNGQGAAHQSDRAAAVSGGANEQGSAHQSDRAAAVSAGANEQGSAHQSDRAAAVSAGANEQGSARQPDKAVAVSAGASDRQTAGPPAGGPSASSAAAAAADRHADRAEAIPAAGPVGRDTADGSSGEKANAAVTPETPDRGPSVPEASAPDPPAHETDRPAPVADHSKDASAAPNAAIAQADRAAPSEHANPGEKTKTKC